MFVCYGLKFFSHGSRDEGSADDDGDSRVDVAARDEPASELPMVESASATGEGSEQLSAMPAVLDASHVGTDGAISVGQDEGGLRTATVQSRIFRITVNGKTFEAGVEQATGIQPVVQSVSQVVATPAPVAQRPVVAPPSPPAVPLPAPSPSPTGASNLMKSPLPGKVLKVLAAPGKAFKRGDTLLVIEAMKMENEILAPRDCVVGEVHAEVNQSVKTGEPLLRME
jgi:glutaconyl-CoA decarboxylase